MSDKQATYKIWFDELNTTPSETFLPTFKQFLDLLMKENPMKIKTLRNKFDEETRKLVRSANKAVKELEKLLREVEVGAKKEKIESLPEIDAYKEVRNGKMKVLGEDLPDTLYHAIRLTVEEHRNQGKLKALDRLLSIIEGAWYLDYDKVSEAYPSYKRFKDAKEEFAQRQKEEPWGAFTHLRGTPTFFKNIPFERVGSFARTEIINNLRRFILYLLTPEVSEGQTEGQKIPYSFDKKKAVLKVKGKEIRFKRETRRLVLLALLTKKPGGIYYSEAAEGLEGAGQKGLGNAKNTYYEVCRGIEARFLRVGISDFLEYNFNRAKINPRYKRTTN